MSDSVRPHRRQPTRLPRPWDSPGRNTGVGAINFSLEKWKSAISAPPSTSEDVEHQEHPLPLVNVQNVTTVLEDNLAISYRPKHSLSSNCAPKHVCNLSESCVHTKLIHECSWQLYWQLPKLGSKEDVPIGEQISGWINKLRNIHTMEYYVAIKRDELSSHKEMQEY